jgi:hypothetical protein
LHREECVDYLDTEPGDQEDDEADRRDIHFDRIAIVERYYALPAEFRHADLLTAACLQQGGDLDAWVDRMERETKEEREARLIRVGAPCADDLVELQALRLTGTPEAVREMEEKLENKYRQWFTQKPKPQEERNDNVYRGAGRKKA